MSILILMIPMALLFAAGFLWAFFWAADKGQFDDLDTPALRMLVDDDVKILKDKKLIKE